MSTRVVKDKGIAKELLARALKELELKSDGGIQFRSLHAFDDLLPVLCSCFSTNHAMTLSEKVQVIRKAVLDLRRKDLKSPSVDDLIRLVDKGAATVLSQSSARYYMTSTVSLRRFPTEPTLRYQINGVRLCVSPRLPKNSI